MLNLVNVYISIRWAVPEDLSFSCILQDMSSRGTLRSLSLLFVFLSISRSLLEVPLKFCMQISPLPWNDTILHFIQEVALVMCLPNPCLHDNQKNSYLQPDSRHIFSVVWGDTIGWLCNHSPWNVPIASYMDKHSSPSPHMSQDHFCWAMLLPGPLLIFFFGLCSHGRIFFHVKGFHPLYYKLYHSYSFRYFLHIILIKKTNLVSSIILKFKKGVDREKAVLKGKVANCH